VYCVLDKDFQQISLTLKNKQTKNTTTVLESTVPKAESDESKALTKMEIPL